jgi:hypothetical protein
MCCPLDNLDGRLTITPASFEQKKERSEIKLEAIYDRTPTTLADRIFRLFQRVELLEKIAEIADESFHLFGTLLQKYTTVTVYQTLRNLHHAAHDIEHLLHTFCFLGDLSRLMTGKFFQYQDIERKQLNYLRSAARVCHAVSHFLASAAFFSELKLCQVGRLEKAFKYASVFSTLGYALWTISLILQRYKGENKELFASDLGIHLAGCLFEAIPLTKTMSSLAAHAPLINKVAAIAGVIHAWCVVQRLMPNDQEAVTVNLKIEIKDGEIEVHSHANCDKHSH